MQLARHGGEPGIRDDGRLDSILQAPQAVFEQLPDTSFHQLAATYVSGLAKGKPFVDANKRTALVAGATFLYENGWQLKADQPDAVIATARLASGDWTQEQFGSWLQNHSVQI